MIRNGKFHEGIMSQSEKMLKPCVSSEAQCRVLWCLLILMGRVSVLGKSLLLSDMFSRALVELSIKVCGKQPGNWGEDWGTEEQAITQNQGGSPPSHYWWSSLQSNQWVDISEDQPACLCPQQSTWGLLWWEHWHVKKVVAQWKKRWY